MALSPDLVKLLACPKTREPLEYLEEKAILYAREARLSYRVEDDLPILLVEEGRAVDDEEAAELEALLSRRAT